VPDNAGQPRAAQATTAGAVIERNPAETPSTKASSHSIPGVYPGPEGYASAMAAANSRALKSRGWLEVRGRIGLIF
jgi:hypothetical protein